MEQANNISLVQRKKCTKPYRLLAVGAVMMISRGWPYHFSARFFVRRMEAMIQVDPKFSATAVARALIVDDESDGARLLGLLLTARGFAVDVVTDSQACLARL